MQLFVNSVHFHPINLKLLNTKKILINRLHIYIHIFFFFFLNETSSWKSGKHQRKIRLHSPSLSVNDPHHGCCSAQVTRGDGEDVPGRCGRQQNHGVSWCRTHTEASTNRSQSKYSHTVIQGPWPQLDMVLH